MEERPSFLALLSTRFKPKAFTAFQASAVTFAAALLFLGFVLSWLSKLEETAPLSASLQAMSLWRKTLLEQLLHGRLRYFETHSANDLATRLSDDAIVVESLLVSSLKAYAKSLPALLLMLGALSYHSPVLAFAFFIAVLPFYAFAHKYVRADWVRSKKSDLETAHYRHGDSTQPRDAPRSKIFVGRRRSALRLSRKV